MTSNAYGSKVGWFNIRSGIILAFVVLVELADTTSSAFLIPHLKQKWSQFHDPIVAQLTVVLLFAGMLVGNIVWAILADRYGRRRVLFPCIIMNLFAGASIALSETAFTFILFRTVQGFAAGGLLNVAYVLFSELLPPSHKMTGLMQFKATYGVATAFGTLCAYLSLCTNDATDNNSETWRILPLINVPLEIIILFLLAAYVPESPSWLVSQNRGAEAMDVISNMKVVNEKGCWVISCLWRSSLHSTFVEKKNSFDNIDDNNNSNNNSNNNIVEGGKKSEQQFLKDPSTPLSSSSSGVDTVHRHRFCGTVKECLMTLAFLLLRGSLQFTSTWMLFVVPKLEVLQGQQYSMQALVGLCKIVGAIITIRLINANGKNRTLTFASALFALALCVVSVGVSLFPKNNNIYSNSTNEDAINTTTFGTTCGNGGGDSSFFNWTWAATVLGLTIANVLLAILYALSQLLVIEYYPTHIRSTALGLCMVVQRFSSMMASFLAETSDEVGSMEISAGIVSFVGIAIFFISSYVSYRKQHIMVVE